MKPVDVNGLCSLIRWRVTFWTKAWGDNLPYKVDEVARHFADVPVLFQQLLGREVAYQASQGGSSVGYVCLFMLQDIGVCSAVCDLSCRQCAYGYVLYQQSLCCLFNQKKKDILIPSQSHHRPTSTELHQNQDRWLDEMPESVVRK